MKESDIRARTLFEENLDLTRQDVERFFDRARRACVSCPGCGGESLAFEFSKQGLCYETCSDCGALFVTPRPEAAALALPPNLELEPIIKHVVPLESHEEAWMAAEQGRSLKTMMAVAPPGETSSGNGDVAVDCGFLPTAT